MLVDHCAGFYIIQYELGMITIHRKSIGHPIHQVEVHWKNRGVQTLLMEYG